jgi:hypothetical protein
MKLFVCTLQYLIIKSMLLKMTSGLMELSLKLAITLVGVLMVKVDLQRFGDLTQRNFILKDGLMKKEIFAVKLLVNGLRSMQDLAFV